jgi:methyl-accepting chemotaxis protein
MRAWKVSTRLYLIAMVAGLVMAVLAGANWIALKRLDVLQDDAYIRAQQAGNVKEVGSMADSLYRIVADTFINRDLADVQKKWQAMTVKVDSAMADAAKLAQTDAERQSVAQAIQAMKEIRTLYTEQYLPLVKRDAPNEEVAVVDDKIDKLIDRYDESFGKLAQSLEAQAKAADDEFGTVGERTRWIMVASALAGGVLLVGLALLISRSITQQLGMEPADALATAHRISQGDLTIDQRHHQAAPGSVAFAMASIVQTVNDVVHQVRLGADEVASASAQIANGNMDLSQRTEQQASGLASQASDVAVRGGEVVQQVVQTMDGITDASRQIGDIISVIDGIAFQTNILALNAAVEAARAGEQGRGFAVVASEVRSLAQRSAEAAKQIKTLINTSVERVEAGSTLVGQAGQTMNDIVSSIQRVSQMVNEISVGSDEQSRGIGQVGQAVAQMDNSTQQNAALVEESAAAAASLRQRAQALVDVVGRFKTASV